MSTSTRQFEGSDHSAIYAKFRPVPPTSIISHILSFRGDSKRNPPLHLAVDVGCGSGQFTGLLLPVCEKVLATDVSKAQVEQAKQSLRSPNLEVKVGKGEEIDVKDESVDLVTVCQALHWMEVDQFYKEVDRVLVPGGTLAVIGYHFTRPATTMGKWEALTEEMVKLYKKTSAYWSTRRALVDAAYTTIPQAEFKRMEREDTLHFTDIDASLADWSGYIRTWSGVQTFFKQKGNQEGEAMMQEFEQNCAQLMEGSSNNLKDLKMKLRTQYWVILYQK